jgi:hypothetical protein
MHQLPQDLERSAVADPATRLGGLMGTKGAVMRRTLATSLGLVVLVLVSRLVGAQGPSPAADFTRLAGTWQLDTAGNPSVPAERRVITLSPEWFRMEIHRAEDDRPPVLTYRFDGRDAVNPFGSGKATSRLLREGAAIVTETIYEINNSPITIRETLSVNPAGSEMTVDATVRVEHGYEGVLSAGEKKSPNVSTAMVVFRKQP